MHQPPLTFDFETRPEAGQSPLRLWFVVGGPEDVEAISRTLRGNDRFSYNCCFIGADNGQRYVTDADLILLAVDQGSFDVFVSADIDGERRSDVVAAAIASLESSEVRLPYAIPRDLVFVQFSPFGRRKFRKASGRSALEQAFESLKCAEILGNRLLQERLARGVLSRRPRSADPIVSAIFSRMRADALRRFGSGDTASAAIEAAELYQIAEECFSRLRLPSHASECARRARLAISEHRKTQQLRFPNFVDVGSVRPPSGLGLTTKQCAGISVDVGHDASASRRASPPGKYAYAGRVNLSDGAIEALMAGVTDPAMCPVASMSEPSRRAGDQFTFRLTVELQSVFGTCLGSRRPHTRNGPEDPDFVLSISSETCYLNKLHAIIGAGKPAVFEVSADREGRHRLVLVLNGQDYFESFRIDISIPSSNLSLQNAAPLSPRLQKLSDGGFPSWRGRAVGPGLER